MINLGVFLMDTNIFKKKNEILNHLEKASLEEINEILNQYKSSGVLDNAIVSLSPILMDGLTYHFKYNL